MQTQTIKIELLINGYMIVIGHRFLENMVSDILDIKKIVKYLGYWHIVTTRK